MATGTTVRALLYNNVIYAKSVTRPLINVGQLKGMLDLRMIWDDSSPLIVVCYAGKKYVFAASKCGASPPSGVQEGAASNPQHHS